MGKKVSFIYRITNPCMQTWLEPDITDDRLKELHEQGCIVNCIVVGKETIWEFV